MNKFRIFKEYYGAVTSQAAIYILMLWLYYSVSNDKKDDGLEEFYSDH